MSAARVLVVDDESPMRDALASALSVAGYEARQAESGVEALREADSWKPDLILLDVVMPGLDGFATLGLLKQDPRLRGIPVVLLTSLSSHGSRARGVEAGAADFVAKPFCWPELLTRVRRLLARG